MAWELAGYGVAAAVTVIAAALLFGIVSVVRSLRRLDRAVADLSKEAEASLRGYRRLADEASEAIQVSRQSLQGFASLAEGARALGEAVRTAAQTAVHVTELYREILTSPIHAVSDDRERKENETPNLSEIVRRLWMMWKRREGSGQSSGSSRNPGPSADPSEGE